MLKAGLNRQAIPGVRMVDHPLPESCWVAVMRDALKPRTAGTIPAGPVSSWVITPLLCVTGIACAAAPAEQSKREREMIEEAM